MDTLFENGAVLTLEDGARTAEALLVRDGRIVLAGTREEAGQLARTGARRFSIWAGCAQVGSKASERPGPATRCRRCAPSA